MAYGSLRRPWVRQRLFLGYGSGFSRGLVYPGPAFSTGLRLFGGVVPGYGYPAGASSLPGYGFAVGTAIPWVRRPCIHGSAVGTVISWVRLAQVRQFRLAYGFLELPSLGTALLQVRRPYKCTALPWVRQFYGCVVPVFTALPWVRRLSWVRHAQVRRFRLVHGFRDAVSPGYGYPASASSLPGYGFTLNAIVPCLLANIQFSVPGRHKTRLNPRGTDLATPAYTSR
jgi:hypothetical protein